MSNNRQCELNRDYEKTWTEFIRVQSLGRMVAERLQKRKPYHQLLHRHIQAFPDPVILELGCGAGSDIRAMKQTNPNARAFGTDILPESIRISRTVASQAKAPVGFFVSDIHQLPVKSLSVHVVFSQGLMEHFTDVVSLLREQARIIAPGGALVMNVPQRFTGYTIHKHLRMRKGTWQLGRETSFSWRNMKALGRALKLPVVDVIGYQYWRSWGEPAFVLRDLVRKLQTQSPVRFQAATHRFSEIWDRHWNRLESRLGHYFLQNIVVVFRKPE